MNLYSIPPILSLLCFLGLALLTYLRRPKTAANILFLLICVLGVFLYADILIIFQTSSQELALLVSRLDHVFAVYTIPMFIHFFHAYLKIAKRRWLVYAAYSYAVALMGLSFSPGFIEGMQAHPFGFYGRGGPLYVLTGMGAAVAVTYGIAVLVWTIRRETSSIHKNKLKYILGGFGLLGVLNGLNVFPLLGYAVYPPGAFSFVPLIVFGVGLFKYDLLDMGVLIKKSLLYSTLSAVFSCIYALVITVANHAFQASQFSDSIFFAPLFFFLIAVGFGPVRRRIQQLLDMLFGREKLHFHRSIKSISRSIASSLKSETILMLMTTGLGRAVKIARVALYLRQGNSARFTRASAWEGPSPSQGSACGKHGVSLNSMTVKQTQAVVKKDLLERSKHADARAMLKDMEKLGAELLLPLRIESRCLGFMLLGEKESGSLYRQEEIDMLVTLSVQASLALENAAAYRRLDDWSKNLEKMVDARTHELQQALREKEKSQEQLVRSESLAAIGQLVAGVAHELNNPLSAANSLIQSIREELEFQFHEKGVCDHRQTMKEDIRFAEKELGRAKQIVASLLGLSRQTNTYTEAVDINLVVQQALRVLQSMLKGNQIRVEQNYDVELPLIQGNFANLGQVAINIIKNACQAVRTSGIIKVATLYLKQKNSVLFSCLDDGPGIPAAVQKDMFKPFFTTKAVGQGTGLGLYICHEIIQKHRGSITHENIPGRGTLFKVQLPVLDPPEMARQAL